MYKATSLPRLLQVNSLYSLHYFAYVKRFCFEGESHPFWELLYCDSGEAVIHDDGKQFCLTQGMLFVHAPDHRHDVSTPDVYTNVTVLGFDGDLQALGGIAGRPLTANEEEKHLLGRIVECGRHTLSGPLNLVYQNELTLRDDAQDGDLQTIAANLELLLLSLLQERDGTAVPKAEQSRNYRQSVADNVVSLLSENLGERLCLQEIARQFGFSTAYIKRIFSSVMGCGILQYHNRMKIARAKQLLSESTYTVSQISELLGFDSLQYFSRQFKKQTNMSPRRYRSSLKLQGTL